MRTGEWRWPVATNEHHHSDRTALIREIVYEMTNVVSEERGVSQQNGHNGFGRNAKGLSLNISSGGMLVLMNDAPEVERVIRVHVPTPVTHARTPTLAEVRWTRRIPFAGETEISFVGLKFLF